MKELRITATIPLPDNDASGWVASELKRHIATFESGICDVMGGEYELKTETAHDTGIPDDWALRCLTMRLRPPAH